MYLGVAVYLGFVGTVGWSAVRHDGRGRRAGIHFAVPQITLPAWVLVAFRIYELLKP